MKALSRPRCIAAAVICVCAGSVHASPVEIPVDTAGSVGFVPLVYGSHTVNSALASGLEVGRYTFSGSAGDHISLVTSTATAGLDPVVLLRDPGGAVVASATCNGHAGFGGTATLCAVDLQSELATTGTYTLNMSDSGANNGGAYTLHLDRYPPFDNWQGFAYDAVAQYAIGHLGDSDYYAFNVKAGSDFRLSVATQTAGLDAHVEVWDTAGQLIQSTACNGHAGFGGTATTCNVLLDLTAAADGFYQVGVYDAGWNNTGNYQLGVTCLFGTCATGVPTPSIPELPTAWMLGLGLALLSWKRLRRSTAA